MGTAHIYYYPDPAGSVLDLDLSESWSLLESYPVRSRRIDSALSRRIYHQDLGGTLYVRAVLERFELTTAAGQLKWRGLEALVNHLERGGLIALCGDDTYAWAGFVPGNPESEQLALVTSGKMYAWLPGTLTSDTVVRVESGTPDFKREGVAVSSLSVEKITLSAGLRFRYEGSPVIVREQDTYVGLRLAPEADLRQILTSEHGINGTFDALFVVDWGALADQETAAGGFRGTTAGAGVSFEQLGEQLATEALSGLGGRIR